MAAAGMAARHPLRLHTVAVAAMRLTQSQVRLALPLVETLRPSAVRLALLVELAMAAKAATQLAV